MKESKPATVREELKRLFVKDTIRETVAVWVTLMYLLFQIYRTFINPLPPLILRPIHVSVIGLLCFLYTPLDVSGAKPLKRALVKLLDWFVFVSAPLLVLYSVTQYDRILGRINYLDPVEVIDYLACIAVVIIILGGIWRTAGKVLTIFIGVFIVYGWTAPYLPGILYYKGLSLSKFTDLLILGTDGIYGSATSAASGFMFWIMIFGALFASCGGGDVLIDIGMRFGAKAKDNSGPAKAAVLASGLMGMISGSAAANVAGTGTITIPLMKKAGYEPEEAGAIEAVASTGGQIMPPIMGTGAFLMAELLGINYGTIAMSAVIPAVTYYLAVFLLVHLLARKRAAINTYVPMDGGTEPILPRLYTLLPIAVLIISIGIGYTVQRAAIYGILTILILNVISPKMRYSPAKLMEQLMLATKRTGTVSVPVSGCGILIGIVSISGLATRLSTVITSVGSSHLWVGLLIAMVGCMLLGMALPTVAAYLTAYVLLLPTLRALGISALAGNMFIFYFGIFAQITPPVCVASYTAAGIAGAKPWDTGWRGMAYAACGFFAPFVFVYQPGILLQGTLWEIVSASAILLFGTALLTIGIAGYLMTPMKKWEQVAFIVCGIMVCLPESTTDIIGAVLGVLLIAYQAVRRFQTSKTASV